jgi:hypothetical protein
MTSSSKHLKPEDPFWDYSKHEFKDCDPFCEPGLISILFLAHGKPELTKLALESTAQAVSLYDGEVEWCFMENGENKENAELFFEFPAERKTIITSQNYGIMHGFNQLWSISRGEYCLIHENDFLNNVPHVNFLKHAKDILDSRPNIGIVSLRAVGDPNENWGYGKKDYLPYSCGDFRERQTKDGWDYMEADYPNIYNNNPNIMRKSLWRQCGYFNEPVVGTDPRHDETHYQERVRETKMLGAHIGRELYYHIGGVAAGSIK